MLSFVAWLVLTQCFQGSSMLLHESAFCSFLWPCNSPLLDCYIVTPHLVYQLMNVWVVSMFWLT